MASLVPGETMRVLLVSAQESVRDEVGEALAGRAGDHRLYWVSQPDLAAGAARICCRTSSWWTTSWAAPTRSRSSASSRAQLPQAAILALVRPDDMSAARQAVLAGARASSPSRCTGGAVAALRQVLAGRGRAAAARAGDRGGGPDHRLLRAQGGHGPHDAGDQHRRSPAPGSRTIRWCWSTRTTRPRRWTWR